MHDIQDKITKALEAKLFEAFTPIPTAKDFIQAKPLTKDRLEELKREWMNTMHIPGRVIHYEPTDY